MAIIKRLYNNTGGNLFHDESGYNLIAGQYTEVDPDRLSKVSDTEMQNWFISGDVYFNDGTSDFTTYPENFNRLLDQKVIQKDDSDVTNDVEVINFEGNVSVTDEGDKKSTVLVGQGIIGQIIPLIFSLNGTANNDWFGYVINLAPSDETNALIPFDCNLIALTFTNKRSGVDQDIEVHKALYNNGNTNANVWTSEIRNQRTFQECITGISFNAGDKIAVYSSDQGGNASDPVVILWLQITTNTCQDLAEDYNGDF